MSQLVELTGTLLREKWRPKDSERPGDTFVMAELEDGTTVKGNAPVGDLTPGLPYKFVGQWEQPNKWGKQFKFTGFTKSEPHSRFGVIKYLQKYAPGIGPGIAGFLFDCYGSGAVKNLRNDPSRACIDVNRSARRCVLIEEAAHNAAVALRELSLLEDTRIELANLMAGRGFPGSLTEILLKQWGPLAPVRIKRDPLSLMVYGFPGCGFARCDKLYCDLGLPPGRIKRQMICLWKAIKDNSDGHTWHPFAWANATLQKAIGGCPANLNRALKLGVRSGWLAVHTDAKGVHWVAHGEAARAEQEVVDSVAMLSAWKPPEVCGTATPAEYGEWLAMIGPNYVREFYGFDDDKDNELYSLILEAGGSDLSTQDKVRIGRETGNCQFCGRVLVNPESRSRGYGPTCGERNGLPL